MTIRNEQNAGTATVARRLRHGFRAVLVLVALSVSLQAAMAAEAVPLDIGPGLRAKIAREKGKQMRQRAMGQAADGSDAECGSISIGNADSDAQKARQRLNPRDTTIIITGDLINTARCR